MNISRLLCATIMTIVVNLLQVIKFKYLSKYLNYTIRLK